MEEAQNERKGDDPIFKAINEGDVTAVKASLQQHGVTASSSSTTSTLSDLRDAENRTPLMAACLHNNEQVVELLLNSTEKPSVHEATIPSRNPAMESPAMKSVMKTLKWSGQRQEVQHMKTVRMRKHTPLTIASEEGHLNIIKLLVKHGADINQNEGTTALRSACMRGHLPCVQWLLEQGADATISNSDTGTTPLLAGCIFGHDEIVAELLSWATDKGHVNELLALNTATTTSGGNTAVIMAAARRKPKILQMLLQNGANLHAVNHQGWTALDHAVMLQGVGFPLADEVTKILLDHGAKARPGTFFRGFFLGGGPSCVASLWPHRVWDLPVDSRSFSPESSLEGQK